jgi:hypothetical protein
LVLAYTNVYGRLAFRLLGDIGPSVACWLVSAVRHMLFFFKHEKQAVVMTQA